MRRATRLQRAVIKRLSDGALLLQKETDGFSPARRVAGIAAAASPFILQSKAHMLVFRRRAAPEMWSRGALHSPERTAAFVLHWIHAAIFTGFPGVSQGKQVCSTLISLYLRCRRGDKAPVGGPGPVGPALVTGPWSRASLDAPISSRLMKCREIWEAARRDPMNTERSALTPSARRSARSAPAPLGSSAISIF
ncbi:hypothetical protein EYF80_056344 [Liparis tanakae]|uniref:Uncharacterized protein n=1 Tax=Liparis tanakae TaxID=230148 RepID=A0A4Z2EXZ4_9TELE|nr:hypothetical protein EYF80_056344 [Liparis tanakae]